MSLPSPGWTRRRTSSSTPKKNKLPKDSCSSGSPSPPLSPKHNRESSPVNITAVQQQTFLFVNTIEIKETGLHRSGSFVHSSDCGDNFLGSNSSQCYLGSNASTFISNSPTNDSHIFDSATTDHQYLGSHTFEHEVIVKVNPMGLSPSPTEQQFVIRPVPDSATKKSSHRRARSVDNKPTTYHPTNHNPFFSLILDQSFQNVSQQHQEAQVLATHSQSVFHQQVISSFPTTPNASTATATMTTMAIAVTSLQASIVTFQEPISSQQSSIQFQSTATSTNGGKDNSPVSPALVPQRASSVDERSTRSSPGDMKSRVHNRKKAGSIEEIRHVNVPSSTTTTPAKSDTNGKDVTKETSKDTGTTSSMRDSKESKDKGDRPSSREARDSKDKITIMRQPSSPKQRSPSIEKVPLSISPPAPSSVSTPSISATASPTTTVPLTISSAVNPTVPLTPNLLSTSGKHNSSSSSSDVSSAQSNTDSILSVRRVKKHSKQKSDDTEKISKMQKQQEKEAAKSDKKRMGRDKSSEKIIINPFSPEIMKSIDAKNPLNVNREHSSSKSEQSTPRSQPNSLNNSQSIPQHQPSPPPQPFQSQPSPQAHQSHLQQHHVHQQHHVQSLASVTQFPDMTSSTPLGDSRSNHSTLPNQAMTNTNSTSPRLVDDFDPFGLNQKNVNNTAHVGHAVVSPRKPQKLVRENSLTFSISNVSEFNFKLSEDSSASLETLGSIEEKMNLFQNLEEPVIPVVPVKSDMPAFEVDAPSIKPEEIIRVSLLGKGTFGKVWRGLWKNLPVAIKDMPYPSQKEIQMWKKEIHLLSKLQEAEYLVNIKAYSVSEHFLTIVMQIMEGGSLYDIIHEEKNVPWSMLQKVRILRHVAKGIEAIHAKNIIHRDLKSMNVLMDRNGNAKIADLGCASFFNLTMTLNVGSPFSLWMAPEVRAGSYSFSADIFSYGVVAFEVFNECLPNYSFEEKCVVIAPTCIGYPIIKQCSQVNPLDRPTAVLVIDMMDSLIVTFVSSVMTFLKVNSNLKFDHINFDNDEISYWYNILLHYDRQTFDVLLSNALETLAPRNQSNMRKALIQTNPNSLPSGARAT